MFVFVVIPKIPLGTVRFSEVTDVSKICKLANVYQFLFVISQDVPQVALSAGPLVSLAALNPRCLSPRLAFPAATPELRLEEPPAQLVWSRFFLRLILVVPMAASLWPELLQEP
jgi:hypothetical protein